VSDNTVEARVARFGDDYNAARTEIEKVIVGQTDVVDGVLTAVFASGHVLLEGVPGLGKTSLVRALAETLRLDFKRVQFTPDLMPSDVTGTRVLVESRDGHREFEFQRGPLFANLVLADEINRASPRTQSSLLEAMQERSVSDGVTTYELDPPFFVMATQNPLDMEGTYPLPEAQLDRFLFKLIVPFPAADTLAAVLERTTANEPPHASPVLERDAILEHQRLAREVVIASHVRDYVIRLTLATHPHSEHAPESVREYVAYGASPRGAQALELAAKVRALMDGRLNVDFDDVRAVALPALRHRVLLNFEGSAERVETDTLVADALAGVEAT
jgi:MoxR-like ATPase